MTRVGVVGLGYWGPNLARNLDALPGAELAWICDESSDTATACTRHAPGARVATRPDMLLEDDDLDAVVLTAPLVVDFRGVTRGKSAPNLVRL